MPLEPEERYEVMVMIQTFHDTQVMPLHKENVASAERIEKKVDKLITTDEVRQAMIRDQESRKNVKLNMILGIGALLLALLGFLGYRAHVDHAELISADSTLAQY